MISSQPYLGERVLLECLTPFFFCCKVSGAHRVLFDCEPCRTILLASSSGGFDSRIRYTRSRAWDFLPEPCRDLSRGSHIMRDVSCLQSGPHIKLRGGHCGHASPVHEVVHALEARGQQVATRVICLHACFFFLQWQHALTRYTCLVD